MHKQIFAASSIHHLLGPCASDLRNNSHGLKPQSAEILRSSHLPSSLCFNLLSPLQRDSVNSPLLDPRLLLGVTAHWFSTRSMPWQETTGWNKLPPSLHLDAFPQPSHVSGGSQLSLCSRPDVASQDPAAACFFGSLSLTRRPCYEVA